MDIVGSAAVVTGGATGMGGAVATALAARGAKVAVLARSPDKVEAKASDIGGSGIVCDIADATSVARAFDAAERLHGPARICVNAAAYCEMAPLLHPDGTPVPPQLLADIIHTNLTGALFVAQAFAHRLARAERSGEGDRGVLINVSSISAHDGMVGASYVASKAGVDALALCIARELAPWGIRSMTIAPGGIDTDMLRHNMNDTLDAYMRRMFLHPRRLGRPDEFAALAVHVIENEFLNGSVIRLDGGVHMPFLRDGMASTRGA